MHTDVRLLRANVNTLLPFLTSSIKSWIHSVIIFFGNWLIEFYDFLSFQGTEVKAITYSNMQIYDENDKHEVYVIIDI